MVRIGRLFLPLTFVLALALVVFPALGCGEESAETGDSNVVLEVIGPDGTRSYTLDELRDLRSTEGYGGMKSSSGRITPPALIKGVGFDDLLAEVGGLPQDMAVSVVAGDGYELTMSAEQIESGDFVTYDKVTGEGNAVDGPLTAIIGYEYDGKPVDPQEDGPLRMAIVGPEQNQVTDGHWSIKQVTKVQVKAFVQEWTLTLRGEITEEMDRPTFESGAAIGCHGHDWTDAGGDTWTGIPLYLLVGRVDDDLAHGGPAYNRDLVKAGYLVRITTAAGKSIELASESMYYRNDLIVAYKLNGEALPGEYWPLRLVGVGVDASDMVGQITEIEVLVPVE